MSTVDIWTYREQTFAGTNLTGFKVEATDGEIGKVDEATNEAGTGYLVVDTGPWIFGKKVMLPAGVIDRVDFDDKRVFVDRTKDEIKNAPEFDETRFREPGYRDELGGYYGRGRF
jgi:ribosomal 30S subunit maturation factor RimM